MNIDLDQAREQLLELHRRELIGLDALTAAVIRAQEFGLCSSGPALPSFPLVVDAAVPVVLRGPSRAEAASPKRASNHRPAKTKLVPKARNNAGPKDGTLREGIRDWATSRQREFTTEDLPPNLRVDIIKTKKALSNMEAARQLVRVKIGVYRINKRKEPAACLPAAAVPAAGANDTFKSGSYQIRQPAGRVNLLQSAIEETALKLGAAAKWTPLEMIGWLTGSHQHLVDTDGKRSDVRMRLIDMASAQWLIREGTPPHVTYRLGGRLIKRDVPVNEEPPLKISVPRD